MGGAKRGANGGRVLIEWGANGERGLSDKGANGHRGLRDRGANEHRVLGSGANGAKDRDGANDDL